MCRSRRIAAPDATQAQPVSGCRRSPLPEPPGRPQQAVRGAAEGDCSMGRPTTTFSLSPRRPLRRLHGREGGGPPPALCPGPGIGSPLACKKSKNVAGRRARIMGARRAVDSQHASRCRAGTLRPGAARGRVRPSVPRRWTPAAKGWSTRRAIAPALRRGHGADGACSSLRLLAYPGAVKNREVCPSPITRNLVQRQNERGRERAHTPRKMTGGGQRGWQESP